VILRLAVFENGHHKIRAVNVWFAMQSYGESWFSSVVQRHDCTAALPTI